MSAFQLESKLCTLPSFVLLCKIWMMCCIHKIKGIWDYQPQHITYSWLTPWISTETKLNTDPHNSTALFIKNRKIKNIQHFNTVLNTVKVNYSTESLHHHWDDRLQGKWANTDCFLTDNSFLYFIGDLYCKLHANVKYLVHALYNIRIYSICCWLVKSA